MHASDEGKKAAVDKLPSYKLGGSVELSPTKSGRSRDLP